MKAILFFAIFLLHTIRSANLRNEIKPERKLLSFESTEIDNNAYEINEFRK